MIDKEYFDTFLPQQFEQLGSARATVTLHNGQLFRVHKIERTLPGYVLLSVFPEEGVNETSRQKHRKPGGTQEVFWDKVALPYASISYVLLSVTEPDAELQMGFRC